MVSVMKKTDQVRASEVQGGCMCACSMDSGHRHKETEVKP